MICTEFDLIMRKYMDFSDRNTVRMVAEATTNNQTQILTALTSRLYDLIVDKADKIDYSTISKSRGDITKIQNYDKLVECVDLIRKIVIEYKQPTTSIDVVNDAMANLRNNTATFKKAFSIGAPIPCLMYNNVALAVVNSVSFMIATCIEYIKTPDSTFEIALNKVAYNQTMNNLLFKSLQDFNIACKSNEFETTMKVCLDKRIVKHESAEIDIEDDSPFLTPDEIKDGEDDPEKKVVIHDTELNEGFFETTLGVVARSLVFIIKVIVPFLRNIVYYFYSTRQTITDYFTVQAQMLEMNAYQLQYNNNIDEDRKKKAIEKQLAIASKFRNIANKFAIDNSVATKNAEKIQQQEEQKYNMDDIVDTTVEDSDDNIF